MNKITDAISGGKLDETLRAMYGDDKSRINFERNRYIKLADDYAAYFGDNAQLRLLSVPGRSEVGGNHTDHNHGKVLACSVDLDIIAAAAKTGGDVVTVKSEGFDADVIELSNLKPHDEETGHSASLVRGICHRLRELGFTVGGFNAYTLSRVLKGSGLSSSAAFEVMVVNIISHLFNDGRIDALTMAKVSQYAENEYFGKPCGLMDQTACAVGGFVAIDFKDTANPLIEKINFDFARTGYTLCIVDTAGNHSDLTADYAAIRSEMRGVAEYFGKETLRDCDENTFFLSIPDIRQKLGDRSVLRAIHFFAENRRVDNLAAALKSGEFDRFLETIKESGRSSFMYLQNCYSLKSPENQGIPLALALAEKRLGGSGAFRVHGGGFAGTIQVFVPDKKVAEFTDAISNVFGKSSCHLLKVRPVGATAIL